ncbi:alpha/beta fold hydrolase [Thiohalomonas denitrificans]|uniref:Pimeloyl-ACP methyl ester carboxylesterase n=1 Tax=Thiohalomonas denitrificans TaxID=415747 RepID=A0A1G5QMZ9_9GAMM|nr:alpha/beta hydrolase [Thiohalomonas denitrificans]SCZ63214.1 Pimeloyl-ACP methyl ester carboxylesterase [Thiohalomonas denitrificans]
MKIFRLQSGRRLAYAEYGDPAGTPVFYFHGTPGSRLEPGSGRLPAGVRLIAPERPGFGYSDPEPGRTLTDWADDVAELADHLALSRFNLLGFSGGGPHALACGQRLAGRIDRLGVVSSQAPFSSTGGPPPMTRAYYEAALGDPEVLTAMLAEQVPDGNALWRIMTAGLSAADDAVFRDDEITRAYRANLSEAIQQNTNEIVRELRLLGGEWPFSTEKVRCPVQLWHGTEDLNAPPEKGRYLAETLPDCNARFLTGRGHFFLFEEWGPVLEELTKRGI